MRGLYSNLTIIPEEVQLLVQEHFSECPACRQWREKHKRVLEMNKEVKP